MKFNLTNMEIAGDVELGIELLQFPKELQDQLLPENTAFSAEYGYTVLVHKNTVVVADPGYSGSGSATGAVYVYARAGANWVLEGILSPPSLTAGARFGESLSLYDDTLIVGAPVNNVGGTVYSFQRNQGQWLEITSLEPAGLVAGDYFGGSVSIYGNAVALSAKNKDNHGVVYVYSYIDNIWEQVQQIDGTENLQEFGKSVALQDISLVIGSPGYQTTGAVYAYSLSGSVWVEDEILSPGILLAGDEFGKQVSLDQALFVASTSSGRVFIFEKTETGWLEDDSLFDNADFGKSISISNHLVAVSEFSASTAGVVKLYSKTPTGWLEVETVNNPDTVINDSFGNSVSVYDSLLVIGAPGVPAVGKSYIFVPVSPDLPPEPPAPDLTPALLEAIPDTGYFTGGQQVVIRGENLSTVTSITFNGVPATGVYSLNNTSVSVITPPGAVGPATVSVVTPYGSDTADLIFTYVIPPATITSVSPKTGSVNGGTSVTITGLYLTGASVVLFDGVPATSITVNSDTEIVVVTPVSVAGWTDISVTTPNGTAVLKNAFLYFIPPPTITDVTPLTGSIDGGTLITITGLNLLSTQSVNVGPNPATGVYVSSDTVVTALTPEGSVSTPIPVTLTTLYGLSNNDFEFTYVVEDPVVDSITPDTGSVDGGDSISIHGDYFVDVTSVQIGGNNVGSMTVVNKYLITGTTPAGVEGTEDVSVTTTHGATLPNSLFTYFVPPPDVFSVSPNQGVEEGGTLITITGNNLTTASAVTIGGAAATSLTVVDDETVTVVTPAGTLGFASVLVTTDYGTNDANTLFEYYIPPPVVDSVAPNTGSIMGGTSITITGNFFEDVSSVTIDGAAVTDLVVVDVNTITATTPAGLVGPASIVVTTLGGSNAANTLFTYENFWPSVETDKLVPTSTGTTVGGGDSVDSDGTTVVYGLPYSNPSSTVQAGAVVVFVYDGSTWNQEAVITAPVPTVSERFGTSVAISGDTLVVGAIGYNSLQGRAYIYSRSGSTWTHQVTLEPDSPAVQDYFGNSVSIDGNVAIIGSYGDDVASDTLKGTVYVFRNDSGTWNQEAVLTPAAGPAQQQFGYSVDYKGNTLAVGAAGGAGAVYVFTRDPGTETWTEGPRLTAADGVAGDKLGTSISLSPDETTIVAGTYLDDTETGAAYVFYDTAGTWAEQARIVAPDRLSGDRFGWSVAVDGDVALVGAPQDDIGATSNAGGAYVFTRSGTSWSFSNKLQPTDVVANSQFGIGVSLLGDTGFVTKVNPTPGSLYIFEP